MTNPTGESIQVSPAPLCSSKPLPVAHTSCWGWAEGRAAPSQAPGDPHLPWILPGRRKFQASPVAANPLGLTSEGRAHCPVPGSAAHGGRPHAAPAPGAPAPAAAAPPAPAAALPACGSPPPSAGIAAPTRLFSPAQPARGPAFSATPCKPLHMAEACMGMWRSRGLQRTHASLLLNPARPQCDHL